MRYRIILIFVYSFTFSSVSINDLSYGAQIDTNFQILFVSERDGNPEIYTICSDSSQERRVTDNGKVNLYTICHTQQSAIIFIHDPGDVTLFS
jgi:Tol biopolymer transport system component